MDNLTDFLLTNSAHAIRPQLIKDEKFALPPVEEHGFSALIDISESHHRSLSENDNNKKYLFDTGVSENGVVHNTDVFGIDLDKIDGIILSHGHFDHFAGLVNILKRITLSSSFANDITNHINVFTHPDAFLKRWGVFPDGKESKVSNLR
jgi:7,8-dihydropterin-6-yl-methyl-4-(beta-D-ribofuranosyl)aminobenzene 5'-phosphate synthase